MRYFRERSMDEDTGPYIEITKEEYALLILTGEWCKRGMPCRNSGCFCGGEDGGTLVRNEN